ncbi:NADH dehydrogenase [ubiquinone] 1 subunit C2-like [Solea senegalensis]|uniref:NADH dehydrogenase [ubiquinone] 1 subunit C2 n=1 Tax=Solea senegalensis TaxID=28829 RepID=A0AAV6PZ22_SOLSE|nr:NADH dehydrogenase [ubiquinone] 1 subunit C2 [Solea senegalensis]KAG7479903.1 NADH dehydrogenase [ubiquinone] 1 subunit C2-like [Solea senegalensis]
MGFIPDEAKSLPPPGILNRTSLWLGGIGWCTAMLHNAINLRPPLKSGVHRQVLLATIGWFIGYHVTKLENYKYANHDREMIKYMKFHPEEFVPKEVKTFAEINEPFHPIR